LSFVAARLRRVQVRAASVPNPAFKPTREIRQFFVAARVARAAYL